MDHFIADRSEGVLIGIHTPLISNLDMKENIALIREVHHKKQRLQAEAEAVAMLKKVSMEHIADLRSEHCSVLERFCVMFIRALMCDTGLIYIQTPLILVQNAYDIQELTAIMKTLNDDKGIIILDTKNNATAYKDCECPMTE